MKPSAKLIAGFADKAKGVLVETHRLNAGEWDVPHAERHQEDLRSLADYAGNLGLNDAFAAILDLYAYVSVFTEGTAKPNPFQRTELDRLIQSAQATILELLPSALPATGAVVCLLAIHATVPSELDAALRQEGLQLAVFDDADTFAEAIRQRLPQAILADAALVGAVSELLDELAPTAPEVTRLPLVGIGASDNEPAARLQSLVGGADLFLPRLDDPTVAAQIKELLGNQSAEPFRVLVVDDDRQMCTYCDVVLTRAGMRVDTTTDAAAVVARVRQFKPDLVLMDLYLSGMDGLTLTAQLRQQAEAMVLPIVFLSGEQSEEARFQAIQVGGDDFLTKPIRPRHLIAAVRSRIKRVRALGKQLSRRPGDAPGHLRRGAFLDYLREVKQRPPGGIVVLLVITVDQGGDLQERLSLSVGHELEQAVALRLAQGFSESDRYCLIQEFGFGLLIEPERRSDLLPYAETLRALVMAQPFKVDGSDLQLTVSIGFALMPKVDRSVDEWIGAAFAAVHTAARSGGNRVEGVLSDSGSGPSLERVVRIRELLRDAGTKRGMVIDYQPLIPLRGTETGRYAMHMHLRDRRDPLGGITRSEFVPVAREMKFQGTVDRLVIGRAIQALDDQRTRNRVTDLLVPVDFTAIDRDQLLWMKSEFTQRQHTEQKLTLEFDAAFLTESRHAGRLLERLRGDGVRLGAVERSGRLTSIAELAKLPLNVLRLPAAALQALNPTSAGPLLASWYQGGRELIVEDVRDLNSIAGLWNLGVDYLQGDALAAASPRLDFDFSDINLG